MPWRVFFSTQSFWLLHLLFCYSVSCTVQLWRCSILNKKLKLSANKIFFLLSGQNIKKKSKYHYSGFFFSKENTMRFQIHICQAYTHRTMPLNSELLKKLTIKIFLWYIEVLANTKSFSANLDTIDYTISKNKHHFSSQT